MHVSAQMRLEDEEKLRAAVYTAKGEFGAKCHKYAGALTVECLRSAFAEHGIPTFSAVVRNLKQAIALHLEGEDVEALGLSDHLRLRLTLELPLRS